MSTADRIWERATDGRGDGEGDHALAAVLVVHGLVMNGGVLNAVETAEPEEIAEAKDGYRWLGLDAVADIFTRVEAGHTELDPGDAEALEDLETTSDDEYYDLLPDDAALEEALAAKLAQEPDAFDPV